jgi:hypothetical protein
VSAAAAAAVVAVVVAAAAALLLLLLLPQTAMPQRSNVLLQLFCFVHDIRCIKLKQTVTCQMTSTWHMQHRASWSSAHLQGTSSVGNAQSCTKCSGGFYADSAGLPSCKRCPTKWACLVPNKVLGRFATAPYRQVNL